MAAEHQREGRRDGSAWPGRKGSPPAADVQFCLGPPRSSSLALPERGGRGHSQQSVGSLSAPVRSVLRDRERHVHHPYRKPQREPGRQQSEGLRQPHRPFLSRGRLTTARGLLTRGTKPATWNHHDRTRYLHPRVHGVRSPAALGRWSAETVPGSGPRPHVSRNADKGRWLR